MMAKAEETVYNKYINVMKKHEQGELVGQKAKKSDTNGALKNLKLYHFSGFSKLSAAAAQAVLDMVLDGQLPLTMMAKKAKEVEQLQLVQAALMGELGETSWSAMCERFPAHTDTDQLCNMFATVSIYACWYNKKQTNKKQKKKQQQQHIFRLENFQEISWF